MRWLSVITALHFSSGDHPPEGTKCCRQPNAATSFTQPCHGGLRLGSHEIYICCYRTYKLTDHSLPE
jgi:hypothetical protein